MRLVQINTSRSLFFATRSRPQRHFGSFDWIPQWVPRPSFRTEALTVHIKGSPGYKKPWNLDIGTLASKEPEKKEGEIKKEVSVKECSNMDENGPNDGKNDIKELYICDQSFMMYVVTYRMIHIVITNNLILIAVIIVIITILVIAIIILIMIIFIILIILVTNSRCMCGMGAFNVLFWAQYLAQGILLNDKIVVEGQIISLAGDPRWGFLGAAGTIVILYSTNAFAKHAVRRAYLTSDKRRIGLQLHNIFGNPGRIVEVNLGQIRTVPTPGDTVTGIMSSSYIPLKVEG